MAVGLLVATSPARAQRGPSATRPNLSPVILSLACSPSASLDTQPTPLRVTGVQDSLALLIYGAGRNGVVPAGGSPELYALDKATGKKVGSVKIPARSTAVPMTFLHNGKQYIVVAMGAGANTSLVALTLPKAGAAGTSGGR